MQALASSARAEHAEAERLAREAVAIITERTDGLQCQGDALCDLAEVLAAAGRREESVEALSEALDRYERKQLIPLARRVRERLASVQQTQRGRSPSATMCSGSRSLSPYMKWLLMFSENRLASVDFPTASATSRTSMGEAPQQTPR